MRIQHNIMAMSAYRNYTNNVSAMKKNLEKLSSGYKINRAGDDAAGLAISEKMRAQITGLETAQKNAKDGISLVQTAEGALTEVHDMLNRMVELATQSANGTYDDTTDRAQMQKEVDQLLDEINRIADSSNFNGIKLLDGTLGLNKAAFALSDTDAVPASDATSTVVGNIAGVSNTANEVTKLHTDGTKGVAGEFTVYLGQAHVGAPATGTASIKVSIGGVTKTLKATAAKKEFTASKIASQWLATATSAGGGGGKYLVVKNDGSLSYCKNETAVKAAANKQGLVYEGKANADGSITYSLKGYVNSAGSAIVAVASDASNLTADNVSSNAFIDLNLDVAIASGTKGACTVNAANVGTNAVNTVMQKDGQMGSTEIVFNPDKLEDGMVISINGVEKTVSLVDGGKGDIDLSDLVDSTGKVASANKEAAMNRIATAFKDKVAGIDVGVNGSGDLTLSENKNASDDVKTAMSNLNTFKGLVKVQKPAVDAGTKVTFDASKVVNGDVLSVTNGNTTTKYVFTDDMTGKTDGNGTKYVDIKGKSSDEIAAAFAAKAGLAADNNSVTFTDGSTILGRGLTLQIGDTADSFNQLNVSVQNMHAKDLGIGGLKISDEVSAQSAIEKIKTAINKVSDVRGTLGATQNRLDHTINNLSVMTENIQDAESTIRDVDVAEEMMAYTKNNILIQSAQAMLAQANQVPQGVLQLLQ